MNASSLINASRKTASVIILKNDRAGSSGTVPAREYEQNITCPRVDMNFISECSTCLQRSLVRYRAEHEKIKFIFTSGHIIFWFFFFYANILKTTFLTIFRRFPKTFRRSPKIFQSCAEGYTNGPNIFLRLPKIAKDFRGGTDDVSIMQQHI